jgi:hypothetical protein
MEGRWSSPNIICGKIKAMAVVLRGNRDAAEVVVGSCAV